jgi:Ca-activated chloride channel family protein
MHRSLRLLTAVAACIGVAVQAPLVSTRQRYRTATDLIAVTVTVRDRDGHLVKNLSQDAFELYEDGQRRPVTQFTNERVPVSFGILLDISDSMFGRRIQEARAAIEQFILARLDPEDEFSLLAFNHRHRVLTAWTNDRSAAAKALEPVIPSGSTAIYDAIIGALPFVELRTRQRAALVVISDGADTASDATIRDVRLALARSEAFVYAIAIDPPESVPLNTRVNLTALGEVTGESGGRTLVMRNTGEMLAALSEIAEELDNQYLLGYIAPNAADGQFHGIRVRVANSDYRVRARNGYIVERARDSRK